VYVAREVGGSVPKYDDQGRWYFVCCMYLIFVAHTEKGRTGGETVGASSKKRVQPKLYTFSLGAPH
jgi:hypothetical protein